MKHIRLDPLGGIAGDMFVSSLIDLRPDLVPAVEEAFRCCPLLDGVDLKMEDHSDGVLKGKRFLVERRNYEPAAHHHALWRDIRGALERCRLPEEVVGHAVGIFSILAQAEAEVHGTAADEVAFHEVGAWDSIADIVAASALIVGLGTTQWSVGALPIGGGRVQTAHGPLPLPAPATTRLLTGFALIDDGIAGERVTPTGAAVIRYLCTPWQIAPAGGRIAGTGHGFGSRVLPGVSNCLRVLCLENDEALALPRDQVAVLECEIDDQSAEDIAQGIDRLRAEPGVLDVVQFPVFGKKGRMMTHLRVLARPTARERVIRLVFEETRTIGVRHGLVERSVLTRTGGSVRVGETDIRFKRVERPGGATIKAEADDIATAAGSDRRDRLRISVAKAASEKTREDE